MADAQRRVILKPPGLGPDAASRLAESLAAAIELQRQLAARSAHVLGLLGGLQEEEHAFYVEHEPATPLDVAGLFDQQSGSGDEQRLRDWATALVHSLRATRDLRQGRPFVHGGLAPGVLLESADGILVVTDFGFAPAICTALGEDCYKNLAVGPPRAPQDETPVSGVWEALAPDVRDRDDRICAFIDPVNWDNARFPCREHHSDIIAAGILLYLLAHHRHPYYHSEPDSHRDVMVVEYSFGYQVPTLSFREDLHKHPDEAVALWCRLVEQMIAQDPKDRLTASSELVDQYFVLNPPRPVDARLKRQIATVLEEISQASLAGIAWGNIRDVIASIRDSESASSELAAVAAGVCDCAAACAHLFGPDWRQAEGGLSELQARSDLPGEVGEKVAEAWQLLTHNLTADRVLEEIEANLAAASQQEVSDQLAVVEEQQGRLETVGTEGTLLGSVERRRDALREEAFCRYEEIQGEQGKLILQANQWLESVQAAAEDLRWDDCTRCLGARPRYVPREVRDAASATVDTLLDTAERVAAVESVESDQISVWKAWKRRLDQLAEAAGISELQHARARDLAVRVNERAIATEGEAEGLVAWLAETETSLQGARTLFEEQKYVEANEIARRLAGSVFPQISEAARAVLAEGEAALAQKREGLRQRLNTAAAALDKKEYRTAIKTATQVEEDPNADDALRHEAGAVVARAKTARMDAVRARDQAVADRDQALAALREGDLDAARAGTEKVLLNENAEEGVQKAAEEILLQASLERHLTYRVPREEQSEDPTTVIARVGDSLSPPVPDWLEKQVHLAAVVDQFETFVQDCTLTTTPIPASEMLQPDDRLGDKYRIIRFLGRGGMGEVYHALDVRLDREVVLKFARASGGGSALDEAVQQEAQAIVKLKHANIMHVNGLDEIDGRRYFETDYINGRDLAEYVKTHDLDERRIAEILKPIAEALAEAHAQNVLHRDIKPQNIYIADAEKTGPWLIDFGLARIRTIFNQRVRTGLCGTPGYIAPEVITSMGEHVDHRADIFAFGCVLYRLLAKHPPFQDASSAVTPARPTVSRVLLNTLRTRYGSIDEAAPDASVELRSLCKKAMAPDPEDRYQNAGEIADDLSAFLRRQAEGLLDSARNTFESRPRRDPTEADSLAQAGRLAERVLTYDFEDLRTAASALLDEIQQETQSIEQLKAGGTPALKEARKALDAGQLEAAAQAADQVQQNPYVPELHADARAIADQARAAIARSEAETRLNEARESLAAKRWQSASEAAAAVLAEPAAADLHADAQAIKDTIAGARRRKRGVISVGAVAVLAVGAGVVLMLVRRPPSVPEVTMTVGPPSVSVTRSGPVKYTVRVAGAESDGLAADNVTLETTGDANGVVSVEDAGPGAYTVTVAEVTGNGSLGVSVTTKGGQRTPSQTFTVDNNPPMISLSRPSESVTSEGAFAYRVTYGGAKRITLQAADVVLHPDSPDGPRGKVTVSGDGPSTRTITISNLEGKGKLAISLKGGTAVDAAGNAAPALGRSEPFTVKAEVTAPTAPTVSTVAIGPPAPKATNVGPVRYTLTYGGAKPPPLTPADITLEPTKGNAAGRVSRVDPAAPGKYTVEITDITGDGALRISVATDKLPSGAALPEVAAFTVDNTPPAMALEGPSEPRTKNGPITYTVRYDGAETITLGKGDIELTPDPADGPTGTVVVSGDGTSTRIITVSGVQGDGMLGIKIKAGTAKDGVGNPAPERDARERFTVDNTPPTRVSTVPAAGTSDKLARLESVTVTFSEPVVAVSADALTVNGEPAKRVDGRGPGPWTFEGFQKPSGGTATVTLDRDKIEDQVGNRLAAGSESWTYTLAPAGWTDDDSEKLKSSLVDAGSRLEAYPGKIEVTSDANNLTVTLACPWDERARLNPISVGIEGLPESGRARYTEAEAGILAKLDEAAPGLVEYLRFWDDRKRLEARLPSGTPVGQPVRMDAAAAQAHLAAIAKIKWQSTADATIQLAGRTEQIQAALGARTRSFREITPTRFIEYFVGPESVHAIYWFADRLETPRYVRLGETAAIANDVKRALSESPPPAEGPQLQRDVLGPIVQDTGFFTPTDNGTFGVCIAPDGPLCFLPLSRLRFGAAVDVKMTLWDKDRGATAAFEKSVTHLGGLCGAGWEKRATGIWMFHTLAADPQPGAPRRAGLWDAAWRVLTGGKDAPPGIDDADLEVSGRTPQAMLIWLGGNAEHMSNHWNEAYVNPVIRIESEVGSGVSDAGLIFDRIGTLKQWFVLRSAPVP